MLCVFYRLDGDPNRLTANPNDTFLKCHGGGNHPVVSVCHSRDQGARVSLCKKSPSEIESASNPVIVPTGAKFQRFVDFETQGPNRLAFERYYNSQNLQSGNYHLGTPWSHSYSATLVAELDNFTAPNWIDAVRPNGRTLRFTLVSGTYQPDSDETMTLAKSGTDWILTDGDRVSETYTAGLLQKIAHAGGYEITLSYDGPLGLRLDKVTDSHGRVLDFTVSNISTNTIGGGPKWRISQMTVVGTNQVYDYGYEGDYYHNLIQVEYPAVLVGEPPAAIRHVNTYDYTDPSVAPGELHVPFLLTGITDENGVRFATWRYDHLSRRVVLSEHAGGVDRTTFAYDDDPTDGDGLDVTVTNPLLKQTVYRYDDTIVAGSKKIVGTDGLASASGNCPATSTTTTYDATTGFLASTEDRQGNTRELNGPNARGLPTEILEKDAAGAVLRRTVIAWHPGFRLPDLITISDGAGNKVRSIDPAYDATTGNMTGRTETDLTPLAGGLAPAVRTWTYGHDGTGRVTTIDGPLAGAGDTTTYGYTGAHLTSITLPTVGGVTPVWSFGAHDGRSQPGTVTDPNGLVTELDYDGRGRLIKRTVTSFQGDAVTEFEYDGRGLLKTLTTPLGGVYTYTYDDARRLTAIVDTDGNRIDYPDLDAMGNVKEVTAAFDDGQNPPTITIERHQMQTFDELGRLLTVLVGAEAARENRFGYDLNDDLASFTDPEGNETRFVQDGLRRVIKAIDPSNTGPTPACGTGGVTCVDYDVFDNPTKVTDGRGNATEYLRNGFGEAIEVLSPDAGLSMFAYDDAGRPIARATADGRTTRWVRDARGRIESATTEADGGSASGGVLTGHGLAICTVVPLLGPMQICLPNGLYAPGAVAGGGGGGGTPHVVDYVWDTGTNGIGRLAEITEPSGTTTNYTYGDRGNVLTETRDIGPSEYVTSYAWDLADNLTRITWPGGEAVDYVRDDLGRVTRVDFIGGQVATGIQYDPFGPETASTLNLGGISLASARDFGLDGRLDRTTLHEGGIARHDLSILHDLAGRVSGQTDAVTPALDETLISHDAVSRLKTATGAYDTLSHAYDAVGNRLTRSHDDGTTITTVTSTIDPLSNRILDHGGNTVSYDGAGRMTGRTVGGQAHVYAYGLDGRLASATVGGATTTYRHNALGQRIEAVRSGATTRSKGLRGPTGATVPSHLQHGLQPSLRHGRRHLHRLRCLRQPHQGHRRPGQRDGVPAQRLRRGGRGVEPGCRALDVRP